MNPKPSAASSLAFSGRDHFFRKPKIPSVGSPDYFSIAKRPSWMDDINEDDNINNFQADFEFNPIFEKLEYFIAQLQYLLKENGYQFFYPNELTLIVRSPIDNMNSLFVFNYLGQNEFKLIIRHIQGSPLSFENIKNLISELIN